MTIDPDHTTPGGAARMLPTDRIDYSAITDRSPLRLPGGARVRSGTRRSRCRAPC
jgi:hypothetical protein